MLSSGGDSIKIGIIGAGRVGCSIGKYLIEQGQALTGYYSKSKKSVEQAATFTGTRAFSSLEEIVKLCDVIWITTPDSEIAPVWESIRNLSEQDKIVCHFSGSLSSVVFSNRNGSGIKACSIHPMYAFNDKFTSYLQLKNVIFTIEGDDSATREMKKLFEGLGNRVFLISPEHKTRYHAAAVTASNLMIGLYQMSLDMLAGCGFDEDTARALLTPLVRGNVEKMLSSSPKDALTGPVERGDCGTIEKHLKALPWQERETYLALSARLLPLAKQKNPERDYRPVEDLLAQALKNIPDWE